MRTKHTEDDRKNMRILAKYPEFAVLKRILNEYVDELKDLTTIGLPRLTIEKEVAGRLWAYKNVASLLQELELLSMDEPKKNNPDYN